MNDLNASAANSGTDDGQVTIPVGYSDPLIPILGWPSVTAHYTIASADTGATLNLEIATQSAGLIAGPRDSGDAGALGARDLLERYSLIYYQVAQPDLSGFITTSLEQQTGGGAVELAISMREIRDHAAANYAFCNSASQLTTARPSLPAGANLADLITTYGVDWEALATANLTSPLSEILGGATVNIPQFAIFKDFDNVSTLPGVTDPKATLEDPDNLALPLRVGCELVVNDSTQSVEHGDATLNALAKLWNITLASLVSANAATTGLLQAGFVFHVEGFEVEVPDGSSADAVTLNDVAASFVALGLPIDAVMAAGANGDAPGMFREGAVLLVNRYLARTGETLAVNASGTPTADLVDGNLTTTNLFPSGAPVYLGTAAETDKMAVPLGQMAKVSGVSPAEILRHNGLAVMSTSPGPALPGMVALPEASDALHLPYRIPVGLTLADVAGLFVPLGTAGTPSEGLVTANAAMPATVAGGQTVTVAGQQIETQTGDSFNAVVARANPAITLDQLAYAIADQAGILAVDGLLLCPVAKLQTSSTGLTPATASARFGLGVEAFLAANAATPDLILAGQTILAGTDQPGVSLVTAAKDTLNSILNRFATSGVSTTLGAIAQANTDLAFLKGEALVLLPPPPRSLSVGIGTGGWTFPDVIFPLDVTLTLKRNAALVDEAFLTNGSAPMPQEQAASVIAARRSAGPADGEGGAVTLSVFAAALETAIPGLRVATGRDDGGEMSELWAVSFVDPGGITKVDLTAPCTVPGATGPQPRTYAIRPLSNTLEARKGVEIKPYDPTTGTLGEAETRDYQGIDLEVWASDFLSDVDLFLTAPYAAPALQVAPAAVTTAINAKQTLAAAVASGISTVFAQEQGGGFETANWTAAFEELRQELLVRLSRARETAALLQYDGVVESQIAAGTARLSGAGQIDGAASLGDTAWRKAQISNAKTRLETGTWPVTFACFLPDLAAQRSLEFSMDYAVNELEHSIAPIVQGYDASSWLSFVHPLDQPAPAGVSTSLGTPSVPVPLRSYPSYATLVEQHADFAPNPVTYQDALHWAYVFTYAHNSAAQDQIRFEITFNVRSGAQMKDMVVEDLFAPLAQYAAVAGQLWPELAALNETPLKYTTVLANAAQTFATLAENVATAWATHWAEGGFYVKPKPDVGADAILTGPATETYEFSSTLTATVEDDKARYTTLTLQRISSGGSVGWPEVEVVRPDGKHIALTRQTPSGDTCTYDFPTALDDQVPAFVHLGFQLSFGGLNIADYQSATAKVWVVRNQQLLGPDGPLTNEAFVQRTPALAFPVPLVPSLVSNTPLDIGPWSTDPTQNPLNAVFDAIFDGDPAAREISVAARYGFTIVGGDDPIRTYLPATMQPRYTYNGVAPIITATENWRTLNAPSDTGAVWGIAISLYSTLDAGLSRPILQLNALVSPLDG